MNDRAILRARHYLEATPGAVSGQHGHNHTFGVACAVVKGFDLPPQAALQVLSEWNSKCLPPWSDSELEYKVEQADEAPDSKPRGHLLRARENYNTKKDPNYVPPLNPPRPSGETTFDPAAGKKLSIAEAGAKKLSELTPRSIEELKKLSPKPLPVGQDAAFEAYLSTAWQGTFKSVWCGNVEDSGWRDKSHCFAQTSSWRMRGVPSGLFTAACTFKPGSFSRCQDNMEDDWYRIIESDKASYEVQCAIILFLMQELKLKISMVVDTMGSSLHAWLDRRELSDKFLENLQIMLCGIHDGLEPHPTFPDKMRRKFKGGMGCDPATFRGSQPVRLPGGIRPPSEGKRGGMQEIIYLA